ncbi:MAG: SDR family oxidoreductase [Mangrovicoccus sp.]|nr:SDR family oxidoreductase [Mangrovicoccus sp.]
MGELTGKTVVITGASRGIGASAAREFADAGANVVLAARSEAAIVALAEEIGPQAKAIACDVAQYDQVAAVMALAQESFGSLDVVINNAGVIEPIARLEDSDPAAWAQVIAINLIGVYNGIRAALPVMSAAGGGTVITISSGAASNALEGWSHYCTSKAGAKMLTDCLHKECADQGIRAIGLSPGTVATEMQVQIKASGINPVSQLDPSVHIPADWPARACIWLASSAADDLVGSEVSLRDPEIRQRIGLVA